MPYNSKMASDKRKFWFYLPEKDADKLILLVNAVLTREPRSNKSEITRELLGFPPKEGFNAVTIKEDRLFLAGKIDHPWEADKLTRARSGRKITVSE